MRFSLMFPTAAVLVLSASVAMAAPTTSKQKQPTKPNVVAQATPKTPDTKADGPKEIPGDPATQEARTRYNRGIELYTEGDYKLALIEFQRSYELSPNWRILFNIGEVHFQLNNYALALKALEKYIAEGAKDVPAKRRQEVEKDIESLKSRTAYLTVTSNVEGAEVTIDDNPVGKAPLAPDFLTDSGSHKVVASKPGYRSASKQVTLAGREHQSITLELVEESKGAGYAAPQTEKSSSVWVGWAATGALAVGATVTGLFALDANSDFEKLQNKRDVSRSELDDQDSKRRTLTITTDILTGAAIVTAGISLYFTLKGSKKESTPHTATTTPQKPRIGVGVLSLTGTF